MDSIPAIKPPRPILDPVSLRSASLTDATQRLQAWLEYQASMLDLYEETLVLSGVTDDEDSDFAEKIEELEDRLRHAGRIVRTARNRYERELNSFDRSIS